MDGLIKLGNWTGLLCVALLLGACGSSSNDSAGLSDSSWSGGDFDSANTGSAASQVPMGTNVSFGGAQDFGFFRGQLEAGQVPSMASLDAPGFFAEHHVQLPPPACGQRICLQPMVAVMGNLMNGNNCTMLNLGLNSPVSAQATERPPLSLAVVVDVSGSMGGDKIAFVREGLELLIDGMRDQDEVAIVTYSDGARVVMPMTAVGANRVELRRTVRSLQAGGSTNLHAGLLAGYQEVLHDFDSGRQNRVILLSDGVPTAGITSTASILDTSRGYNSDGIGLTTIGLGSDFNIDLMRGLAQQADGNFYFLEDSGAVSEVFEEELSFFVVPVAFDLSLELTAGSDYEFGRALGAPLWEDSAGGGSLEIPSVFVAHRESDEDVTADDGRRGGGSSLLVELMPREGGGNGDAATIATIDLSFRAPGDPELQHDRIEIDYPHDPSVLLEEGYFESDDVAAVQKSFVMLNIFVGVEMAVGAFHTRTADADTIAELDNLIAAVEDYNEEVDDRDIELDLQLLDMLRDNLVIQGVPEERFVPRDDPWPAD
ncbi:MAG: VWA domain-containing protein [Myxococcales bacterium]